MRRLLELTAPGSAGEVLTREEAAAYLKVSPAHISKLARGLVLGVPSLRCSFAGRRMLFRRRWLDEFLEVISNEVTS